MMACRFRNTKVLIVGAATIAAASGRYSAQFLNNQSGVPLGSCVVQIWYCPNGGPNVLPAMYNEKAAENSDLRLTVPKEGTTFSYDVRTEKPLP